jgi:hypothetical protein
MSAVPSGDLHHLLGGYVQVRTVDAEEDNGWPAAVLLVTSLDQRAYATAATARAIARDLLAAADLIEPASIRGQSDG